MPGVLPGPAPGDAPSIESGRHPIRSALVLQRTAQRIKQELRTALA